MKRANYSEGFVKEQIAEHRWGGFVSILWHAGFMLLVVSGAKPCIIRSVRLASVADSNGTKGALLLHRLSGGLKTHSDYTDNESGRISHHSSILTHDRGVE
jgi:hypothetical protein